MVPPGVDLATFSPNMQKLVNALLLYKSMFVGPWFAALSQAEDAATGATYDTIRTETAEQARRATTLLQRWDSMAPQEKTVKVTDQVLKRLLEDMLHLKMSSTEVFLGAGISSPTEEMRGEFLKLADIDRRHTEALRKALGVHLPQDPTLVAPEKGYHGVQVGPFPSGTTSGLIRKALDEAKEAGQEPARIVLSASVLRHVRDEGALDPHQGDLFGVPVDIDLSWAGEAFTVASRGRVSLAEIVTEMESNGKSHR